MHACSHLIALPLLTLPDTDGAAGFVCACGNCTIEEYCSGKCPGDSGCDFPNLDTRALDKQDREVLEAKLQDNVDEMIVLFNNFRSLVIDSFVDRNLEAAKVRDYVRGLVDRFGANILTKEDETKLIEARSIRDVFSALHPYTDFFHYEIIELLVYKFGTQEDKDKLGKYVKSFELYCKRGVFEVPRSLFHEHIEKRDVRLYSFKYENDKPSLEDVNTQRKKIAKILKIPIWSLQLCSIEKGCVCLRFWIPSRVADRVFPVSSTQQADFNQLGIRVLKHDDNAPTTEEQRYGNHFLNFFLVQTFIVFIISYNCETLQVKQPSLTAQLISLTRGTVPNTFKALTSHR